MKSLHRREMLGLLLGAGYAGMRAMATGLPAGIFLNPRRGLAQAITTNPNAQYLILSTSRDGCPINCNVPGTYIPGLDHSASALMAPTAINLGGASVTAAAPWATLTDATLARTCFFHHATNTVVHGDEAKVLTLEGAVNHQDQMVSFLAAQLQPSLQTIQAQPISLGATRAEESVVYQGAPQPLLSPLSIASLLTTPTALKSFASLQTQRDKDLDALNALVRADGTPAQQAYIDQYALSQAQARQISQSAVETLTSIADNSPLSQVKVALILFQLNLTPAVDIHIPFGSDNHVDVDLALETSQHVSGVSTIVQMQALLSNAGWQDKITFALMNVFGRTNSPGLAGRGHNQNHHCTVMIGPKIKSGMVGGVVATSNGAQALPIDAQTGAGSSGGNIPLSQSLAAVGKTLGTAVGVADDALQANIAGGQVVAAALTS